MSDLLDNEQDAGQRGERRNGRRRRPRRGACRRRVACSPSSDPVAEQAGRTPRPAAGEARRPARAGQRHAARSRSGALASASATCRRRRCARARATSRTRRGGGCARRDSWERHRRTGSSDLVGSCASCRAPSPARPRSPRADRSGGRAPGPRQARNARRAWRPLAPEGGGSCRPRPGLQTVMQRGESGRSTRSRTDPPPPARAPSRYRRNRIPGRARVHVPGTKGKLRLLSFASCPSEIAATSSARAQTAGRRRCSHQVAELARRRGRDERRTDQISTIRTAPYGAADAPRRTGRMEAQQRDEQGRRSTGWTGLRRSAS